MEVFAKKDRRPDKAKQQRTLAANLWWTTGSDFAHLPMEAAEICGSKTKYSYKDGCLRTWLCGKQLEQPNLLEMSHARSG